MNIIEMTEQAGFNEDFVHLYVGFMTRFAALVRAAALDEAEKIAEDELANSNALAAYNTVQRIQQLKETK